MFLSLFPKFDIMLVLARVCYAKFLSVVSSNAQSIRLILTPLNRHKYGLNFFFHKMIPILQ